MIEVALYGDGRLARGVAQRLGADPGVTLLGPGARDADLLSSGADVVLIATTTLLADVADDIRTAVRAGSNVLVSAEEAAYPWAVDRELADALDALARDAGVTVLGAGLNPGFLFDSLVLAMCSVHAVPDRIRVTRVVDLSPFGPAVRGRLGIGFSSAEFDQRIADGRILGHAGFRQSMAVVAAALGVPIDRYETSIEPLLAERRTAGFAQTYTAMTAGGPWFSATFTGHLSPGAAGLATRDVIEIESAAGRTSSVIEPGVPSLAGAISVVSNSVRRVLEAAPGWRTVAELPPAIPAVPV